MKKSKSFVYRMIYLSRLPELFRLLFQRNNVTILVYHNPSRTTLEEHLRGLARRYKFISLEDFVNHKRNRMEVLPGFSLILTLDDGYKENFYLLPTFIKFNLTPTIFLCSSLVGTRKAHWFVLFPDIKEELKTKSDSERLQVLESLGYSDNQEYDSRYSLSIEEINLMKPIADFQSHTETHPILPLCDYEKADKEISDSKVVLEKITCKRIFALAFPNGNFSSREVEIAKGAGYECALTVVPGLNDARTDMYRLKRILINDDDSVEQAIVKSSGLVSAFFHIKAAFSRILNFTDFT